MRPDRLAAAALVALGAAAVIAVNPDRSPDGSVTLEAAGPPQIRPPPTAGPPAPPVRVEAIDESRPIPPTTTTAVPPSTTAPPARLPRRSRVTVAPSTPQARPPPAAPGGSYLRWRPLVASYCCWNVALMLEVIRCESGGDPTNYNGRTAGIPWSRWRASGLLQLYPAPDGWEDPNTNIGLGHVKFMAGGMGPWVSSRSCWS